ncbi:MAG: hypothetical protein J7M25_05750 [Deltaproteobacteria bacterium]|nr:hypothetical protein [Deltaproteobacteria bacterium]
MLYWLLLIMSGLATGAGLALFFRRPFPGSLYAAVALVSVGLVGLVMMFWKLFIKRGAGGGDSAKPASSPDSNWGGASVTGRGTRLKARQVSALLVHSLETCLDLLRLVSEPEDLADFGPILGELQSSAVDLVASNGSDRSVTTRTRRAADVQERLVELHKKLIERMGGDISEVRTAVTVDALETSIEDQVQVLERCSSRLTHATTQFDESPEIRAGLTTVAQSLERFLRGQGHDIRISSDELALAPTMRLPDLGLIERVLHELEELESHYPDEGPARQEAIAPARLKLKRLADAATSVDDAGRVHAKVSVLTEHIDAALGSLDEGRIDVASRHLNDLLKSVREFN